MGGFCPGGFCRRGDFVQGDFVQGDFVLGGILSGEVLSGGDFVLEPTLKGESKVFGMEKEHNRAMMGTNDSKE